MLLSARSALSARQSDLKIGKPVKARTHHRQQQHHVTTTATTTTSREARDERLCSEQRLSAGEQCRPQCGTQEQSRPLCIRPLQIGGWRDALLDGADAPSLVLLGSRPWLERSVDFLLLHLATIFEVRESGVYLLVDGELSSDLQTMREKLLPPELGEDGRGKMTKSRCWRRQVRPNCGIRDGGVSVYCILWQGFETPVLPTAIIAGRFSLYGESSHPALDRVRSRESAGAKKRNVVSKEEERRFITQLEELLRQDVGEEQDVVSQDGERASSSSFAGSSSTALTSTSGTIPGKPNRKQTTRKSTDPTTARGTPPWRNYGNAEVSSNSREAVLRELRSRGERVAMLRRSVAELESKVEAYRLRPTKVHRLELLKKHGYPRLSAGPTSSSLSRQAEQPVLARSTSGRELPDRGQHHVNMKGGKIVGDEEGEEEESQQVLHQRIPQQAPQQNVQVLPSSSKNSVAASEVAKAMSTVQSESNFSENGSSSARSTYSKQEAERLFWNDWGDNSDLPPDLPHVEQGRNSVGGSSPNGHLRENQYCPDYREYEQRTQRSNGNKDTTTTSAVLLSSNVTNVATPQEVAVKTMGGESEYVGPPDSGAVCTNEMDSMLQESPPMDVISANSQHAAIRREETETVVGEHTGGREGKQDEQLQHGLDENDEPLSREEVHFSTYQEHQEDERSIREVQPQQDEEDFYADQRDHDPDDDNEGSIAYYREQMELVCDENDEEDPGEYFVDEQGNACFVDEQGREYFVDEQGARVYFVDEDGRQEYFVEDAEELEREEEEARLEPAGGPEMRHDFREVMASSDGPSEPDEHVIRDSDVELLDT
ncbi:unnamed protein product [Amoebophrya sp. A25]|nr:unnamed protein product [Amoebophrya sp. A25]|eukprot:GSA25T00002625001.1